MEKLNVSKKVVEEQLIREEKSDVSNKAIKGSINPYSRRTNYVNQNIIDPIEKGLDNNIEEYEEDEEEYEEDEEDEEDEEEEEEPASPIFYKYKGKTYTVDTSNFLQRNFSNVDPESASKMNMCIYKCVRNGCTPYLLYLMVVDKDTNTLIFPNYELSQGSSDEGMEETENRVLDDFKNALFDIYPPGIQLDTQEEPSDLYTEELFRGFFRHEEGELTMVYDATRINVALADDKEYCWVSPYEMFASKQVNQLQVNINIIVEIASASTGSLDKTFYHLKDVNTNELIKDPYVLFLCRESESSGMFQSIGLSSTIFENIESKNESEDTIQILYPRVKHPKIGTYTFFTSVSTKKNTKRFIVFVDIDGLIPLYIEPEHVDKLDHLYDADNMEKSHALTFMNDSQQLWCIKSSEYFSEINETFYMEDNDEANEVQPIVVTEPIEDPDEDPIEDPVEDPIEDPVKEPVEDPIEDPVKEPVKETVEDPVKEPIKKPLLTNEIQ